MKIGLQFAMPVELHALPGAKELEPFQTISGVPFYRVAPDVIACAGGIGKVNAAMACELLCLTFGVDMVVNAGVAGCMTDLPTGTLVVPSDYVQHDMDTSAIGDAPGFVSTVNRLEFPTWRPQRCVELLRGVGAEAVTGRAATGDWFATGTDRARWIRDAFHPVLMDMEGCAIAQVCLRNDVPFVALKSVSDRLFREGQVEEYFDFGQALENLGKVLLPFTLSLQRETLQREAKPMERIASFEVDHTKLLPGLYESRRDGDIVTFDLRFKRPNTGDLLSNAEMHSVEHLIATLLRNSADKKAVIYFGPMGCQTGFYFLFDNRLLSLEGAVELLKEVFAAAADFTGDIPGKSESECGNYANLDVDTAKTVCAFYRDVIRDWTVEQLSYDA